MAVVDEDVVVCGAYCSELRPINGGLVAGILSYVFPM